MCIAISYLLSACSEFESREFIIDKPQSLIDQEALDSYKQLKTYVDYNDQPNFKLGVELTPANVASNSVLYRLMKSHFDEINFNRLSHLEFVLSDGNPVMTNLNAALETNSVTGMSVHAGNLVHHNNQNATYLFGLIPDLIIPGQSGTYVAEDFEGKVVGSSQPAYYSTANTAGTLTIATDPAGKSGKTLRVVGNRVFPQFQITLPQGVKLGDCKSVAIDFRGTGSTGRFGAGMRLGITATFGSPVTFTNYKSPSDWGAPEGDWGRGVIDMPVASMNLTSAQKELTSFVLTVGSETGSADYLMDNVSLKWEKIGQVIPKTPEERKTIFTAELDKWIKAIGEAGKDKIKSWSVVYQPLDDNDPSKLRTGVGVGTLPANTFYWQDYLGKDYAATAIKMLRKYANTTDKVFITETNLVDKPEKIQGLVDFITYTEGQGAQVDGIATELALNVNSDKAKVEAMLQSLAVTKKLIKISALDIGTGGTTSQATADLYQQQAEMYKWFVKAYYSLIPAGQRAGITFRSPHDRGSGDSWRPNEPVGLWTRFTSGSTVKAGYQRKPSYVGVAEGLKR